MPVEKKVNYVDVVKQSYQKGKELATKRAAADLEKKKAGKPEIKKTVNRVGSETAAMTKKAFDKLSGADKKKYLSAHPNSKFQPNSAKADELKARAQKVVTKSSPAKDVEDRDTAHNAIQINAISKMVSKAVGSKKPYAKRDPEGFYGDIIGKLPVVGAKPDVAKRFFKQLREDGGFKAAAKALKDKHGVDIMSRLDKTEKRIAGGETAADAPANIMQSDVFYYTVDEEDDSPFLAVFSKDGQYRGRFHLNRTEDGWGFLKIMRGEDGRHYKNKKAIPVSQLSKYQKLALSRFQNSTGGETAANKKPKKTGTPDPLETSIAAYFDSLPKNKQFNLSNDLQQWFDVDGERITSGKQFAKELMDSDPVMTEGGIIDFIRKHKLVPAKELNAWIKKNFGD